MSPAPLSFCAYEHLGGCSDTLTHRVDYFVGEARTRLGRWAYYCSAHAPQASHLVLERLAQPKRRQPKPRSGDA